jgi:hypothetical protein
MELDYLRIVVREFSLAVQEDGDSRNPKFRNR